MRSSRSRKHKSDSRHRDRSSSSSSYTSISSDSSTEHRHKSKKKHKSKSIDRPDGLKYRPGNSKGFGCTKSRDPKMIASRIFISNLPDGETTKDDLLPLFEKYGKIIGITVLQSFAFVQYEDEESAVNAANQKCIKLKDTELYVKCHNESKKNIPKETQEEKPMTTTSTVTTSSNQNTITIDLTQPPPFEIPVVRPQMPPENYFPPGHAPMIQTPQAFFRPPMPQIFYRERFPRDPFLRDPFIREPFVRSPFLRETFNREPYSVVMEHPMGLHPLRPPPKISDSYGEYKPVPAPSAPPVFYENTDCQIIVVEEDQRAYADNVKKRLLSCGLSADISIMRPNDDTLLCVDEVKRNRVPFAVIITEQNQLRKSITVNILHGSPQEHRNMPLEDAIVLISRSFDKYVLERKKEEKDGKCDYLPPTKTILYIMSLIMEEKFVKADELDLVIDYLVERRDLILEKEGQSSKRKKTMRARSPDQSDANESKLEHASDFEMQLLKMLRNEKAASVAAAATALPVPPPEPIPSVSKSSTIMTPKINMDDPDIKKALENLISTGPNLLKNISQINNQGENKWDGYQY